MTTITIGEETWKRLSARKSPGDSFDDVVTRLLDQDDRLSAEADGGALADA